MIHPSATIDPHAQLGSNVSVGAFSIVHGNVVIGDDSIVESFCEIGYPTALARRNMLLIGKGAHIRSYSIFYQGSSFGDNLVTGHRVTVRENIAAGVNLKIGTMSDLQGDTLIGDYVRAHSNVFIGKASTIGDFVWIFPHVVLTNDPHPPSELLAGPTVHNYAVLATMSVVLPGVVVGEHSLVAAHSLVRRDVDPHTAVGGVPAKTLCGTESILRRDGTGKPAYPWPRHFNRGYPEDVVKMWRREFPD